MIKIVVFGYSLVGYSCLKALIEAGENIVGVFTHPSTPGEILWFPSVVELAKAHGIPVMATESPKEPEVMAALKNMRPDLLFSFYYRKMIPEAILDMPRLGSFNMHGSYLPRYRGRAPVNWAIIHGEGHTGATLHRMVKAADAGTIVDQEAVPIGPLDDAFYLSHQVSEAAVRILMRQLPAIKEGLAPAHPQDETQATYFRGRTVEDGLIDWHQTAWQLHNLIRAVPHPYFPPAFTHYKGEIVEVRTNNLPNSILLDNAAKVGQVVAKGEGWIRVACGDGREFLEITSLSCPLSEIEVGEVLGA